MTITLQPPAPVRAEVDPTRKTALVAGWLFVVTFIASIPAQFICYAPVLDHAGYILGKGSDTRVLWGVFLEVVLVVANIGTAVALFPVLKRQNEGLALGYVTARIMESVFIAVGFLSMATVVTLRQGSTGASGADATSLVSIGKSLVAVHDWTFLLGPGFIVGLGNGLMLGYLMYRSGLVPRRMAMLGLVGGPLIVASGAAVLFGLIDAGGVAQGVATIPEFFWELSFGLYLIIKGFRPSPITTGSVAASSPARPGHDD
jgi:hypothetical protein